MSETTQATQYAAQFEVASDELIATVASCSDEQVRRTTAAEEWPVVVVAHHLGEVYGFFSQMIAGSATGEQAPLALSAEAIDQNNARHARASADVGKPETLDLLRTNQTALVQTLRGLDDEQLDRIVVTFDGNGLSVAQIVESAMIAHTQEHLASIRSTIAE